MPIVVEAVVDKVVKKEGRPIVEVAQEVKGLEVMDNLVGSHDPRKIWMRTKEKDQTLVQDYPDLVKTAEENQGAAGGRCKQYP